LVAEQSDITLAELKAVLATEKVTVGQSSISRRDFPTPPCSAARWAPPAWHLQRCHHILATAERRFLVRPCF
jgi:hypothetical protein